MLRARGFSLFEILLTMIIMSMIVIGGIAWSKRKHEETAAQQLGHRLYLYGMAVSEYGRQNPDGYTLSNPPPNNLYGFDWLKNEPNKEMCADPNNPATCDMFLEHDFNFQLDAIIVSPLIEGNNDSQIQVIFESPTADTVGPLKVQEIRVGKVYAFIKGGQGYHVDPSLDSRAVNFANTFQDQHGTAEITYTLAPLDDTGVITGIPTTMGINVDSGYLRTDGTNEMDADIKFSTAGNGIVFENGNKINKFKSVGPGVGTMPNTPNDSFECPGTFPNDNSYGYGDFAICRKNRGTVWLRLTSTPNIVYNTTNSICFLSGMEKSENGADSCRVIPAGLGYGGDYNSGDWILRLVKGENTHSISACFARCLLFNQ